MDIALSTRWNAYRHRDGQSLVEEILAAGFDRVELGYDLTLDLVAGVREMVEQQAIAVDSVHNFCPVPVGAPQGHPELFLLADTNERARQSAILYTMQTVEFAASVGAKYVVVHGGRIAGRHISRRLIEMCEQNKQFEPAYERLRTKCLLRREKKGARYVDQLCRSIEELMPRLEDSGVGIALENLPSWEAIPSEVEMVDISRRFDTPLVRYWHDIGHARIREQLGFISQRHWLEKLQPCLAGLHIHDVLPPAYDHIMPPKGEVRFSSFAPFIGSDTLKVLEPAPGTPLEEIRTGRDTIVAAWEKEPKGDQDQT